MNSVPFYQVKLKYYSKQSFYSMQGTVNFLHWLNMNLEKTLGLGGISQKHHYGDISIHFVN